MTKRFGWCMDGHHTDCPGTMKMSDGKTHVCDCPHHEQVRRELEELL